MASTSGREYEPFVSGWINKPIPEFCDKDKFYKIFNFYVLHTPCEGISSKVIPFQKDIWRNEKTGLKSELFKMGNLMREQSFFSVKNLDLLKDAFKRAKMSKGFHKAHNVEKIVSYKLSKYNEFISVLYHIRNSIAHGRFSIYPLGDENVFVIEDGIKSQGKFEVRARMILKESTLLSWITIMQKYQNKEKKI